MSPHLVTDGHGRWRCERYDVDGRLVWTSAWYQDERKPVRAKLAATRALLEHSC